MATNFLHATGGSNGYLISPFALLTSGSSDELYSLGSTNTCTSLHGGSSGKFSQANFGSAQYGMIYFSALGAFGGTPAAGANICGWWLHSPDGGTTFEKTASNTALARAPDFIVPIPSVAIASGDIYYSAGLVLLPWDVCKVYVQNNTGQGLGAYAHTLNCAPVADQY